MGLLDSIGGFVKDNIPLLTAGVGAFKLIEQNKANKAYEDYLRRREQQNLQDSQALYEAGLAASGAAAGPLNEALALQQAALARSEALLRPFHDAALRFLPQSEAIFGQGLEGTQSLYANISTPEAIALLNATPFNLDATAPGAQSAAARAIR